MFNIYFRKSSIKTLLFMCFFAAGVFTCSAEDEGTASRIAYMEEKVAADPRDINARKKLAELYVGADQHEKAIEQYEKVIASDPGDIDAMESLALEYMWQDRPSEAIRYLSEVVRLDPGREGAKSALEHLKKTKHDHHKTRESHGHISNGIKSSAEQLDVYRKMAERYLHASAYEKAREYYQDIVKLDPGNVRAQRKLDEIERMMRPQAFAQLDLFKVKGDAEHFVQTYGASLYLEDGYSMETSYVIRRRTQPGYDRYTRQAGTIEISKAFGDGLVLFGGAVFKYYSMGEQAPVDWFFRAMKSVPPDLTLNLAYEKEQQDSKYDILQQRVARHGLSLDGHYNLGRYFSFNADIEADYYTKGYAPDDNFSLSLSASPIVHILKGDTALDLSYTYHRMDFLRKDVTLNASEYEYNYYSPRVLETHAGTLYASHAMSGGRLKGIFSDTISYRPHDGSMHNMIYTELRWKISEADSISGVFVHNRVFDNVGDSFQKTRQFTIKISHLF